jgi:hypothetical protein
MKRLGISTLAACCTLLVAAGPNAFGDDHDKKTEVTLSEPTRVPGAVLQPGTYVFILLNSSSDRHIVEIKSPDMKHLYSMSFATAASRTERTGKVVLTYYEMPAGSPPALRQWFWPGDFEGQELLYPKNEAATISAASHKKVPELTDDENATVSKGEPPNPSR